MGFEDGSSLKRGLFCIMAGSALMTAAGVFTGGPAAASDRLECFRIRSVSDWQAVDKQTIIVTTNVRDQYELKLIAPCQGIQFDESIALQGISGQICTGPTGTVITARGRCPIVAVTRLDQEQEQEQARKGEKRE